MIINPLYQLMKILVALLLLTGIVLAVRPPAPLCRAVPLPEQLPVTIGEEMRFDLEDVFSGTFTLIQVTISTSTVLKNHTSL